MAEFVDRVPEYAIEDGNLRITTEQGVVWLPLRIARQAHAKLARTFAQYDARKASVVKLKGRDHAARS